MRKQSYSRKIIDTVKNTNIRKINYSIWMKSII